ncbi:MAG TPA: hypothetical protein VFG72_07770 [Marmoricola sp.]|nr:hypothetical protein [Marmoricola sp.]
MKTTLLRRLARAGAVLSGLSVVLVAFPASATPPETWPVPNHDPLLQTLAFLLGVPLLVIALVTLAVYLPSMMHGRSTEPALAFHDRNEWFGGPRKGLDPDTSVPPDGESTKGGASAQW